MLWLLLCALMSNPSECSSSWCSMDKNPLISAGFFGAFEGSGFCCNVWAVPGHHWWGEDPWCSAGMRFCCEGWCSPCRSCEHGQGSAGARQPSVIFPCFDRSGSAVVAVMGLPSVRWLARVTHAPSGFNALGNDKGTLWQLSSLCNTLQPSEVWVTCSSKGWLCGVRLLSTELKFFSIEGMFGSSLNALVQAGDVYAECKLQRGLTQRKMKDKSPNKAIKAT